MKRRDKIERLRDILLHISNSPQFGTTKHKIMMKTVECPSEFKYIWTKLLSNKLIFIFAADQYPIRYRLTEKGKDKLQYLNQYMKNKKETLKDIDKYYPGGEDGKP